MGDTLRYEQQKVHSIQTHLNPIPTPILQNGCDFISYQACLPCQHVCQKYEQQKLYKIQTLPNQCTNLYPVCRKVENKTLAKPAYPVNSKETSKLSSEWRHIKRFTGKRQPWISLLTSSQIYTEFQIPLYLTFNSFKFNLTIRIYLSAQIVFKDVEN